MLPPRLSRLLLALSVIGAAACSKSDPGETKAPLSPTNDVSLKGVDTSSLTPRERREWAAQVSELLAPCPEVPVSLAQCIQEQRPCKACLPAAQMLMKQVQAGRPKKDREEAFQARFDPTKVRTLSADGSPEMGPADAPITIIEWADFECPYCKFVSPMLDDLVKKYPGQVRVIYKFFPLAGHPHGELSARAATAAMRQGKFWEMHHLLFENQTALEAPDLDRYAKQLGLDVPKFRVDLTAPETTERIEKDKKQAEGVGLEGTPFVFINGRHVANPLEDLPDWVKLELELKGGAAKAASPATSASAAAGKPAPSGGK